MTNVETEVELTDEKAFKRQVKWFMQRNEIKELGLTEEEVAGALVSHAMRYSGCVNCLYSTPYPSARFGWLTRGCIFRLSQSNCTMRRPIVEKRAKESKRAT